MTKRGPHLALGPPLPPAGCCLLHSVCLCSQHDNQNGTKVQTLAVLPCLHVQVELVLGELGLQLIEAPMLQPLLKLSYLVLRRCVLSA
jgi:hypothetical protein